MSKSSRKTPIQIPSVAEDRQITAAAKADPDAQPLTKAQLAQTVPAKALRGRPPAANRKQLVSVRYSPEVLAYFRSTPPRPPRRWRQRRPGGACGGGWAWGRRLRRSLGAAARARDRGLHGGRGAGAPSPPRLALQFSGTGLMAQRLGHRPAESSSPPPSRGRGWGRGG